MNATYDLVALVGPRAAGKSTLARALGCRVPWPVVDTDDLLGEQVGVSAGEYLRQAGEAAFRQLEAAICCQALARSACIVALGGGAVLSAEVRTALRRQGVLTVLLEAPVSVLAQRQRTAVGIRPPLTDLPLTAEIEVLLAARQSLYEQVAELRVNTSAANVDACVAAIIAKMGLMD